MDEKPRNQPFFGFENSHVFNHLGSWTPHQPGQHTESSTARFATEHGKVQLRVLTWNIDCLIPFGEIRMRAALDYLHGVLNGQLQLNKGAGAEEGSGTVATGADEDVYTVVCFQEMTESDLEILGKTEWVRRRFYRTDIATVHWRDPGYGTTTLIDNRLLVDKVFRVPVPSGFARDGLFVDVVLPSSVSGSTASNAEEAVSNQDNRLIVRVCNCHLESLVADPPLRPRQISIIAEWLKDASVDAGVVVGDFNAIQDFDRSFHTDNGLLDVYLALGGQEGANDGFTWGFQTPGTPFPRSRMDKVMCTGKLSPLKLQRIGVDVKAPESEWEAMRQSSVAPFVTDHYGLVANFSFASKI